MSARNQTLAWHIAHLLLALIGIVGNLAYRKQYVETSREAYRKQYVETSRERANRPR